MNVRGVADTAVDVTYSTKPSLGTAYLGIGAGAFIITNTITTKYNTTQNMGDMGKVMGVGGVADSAVDVIYSTKSDNKLLGVGSITGLNTTITTKTTNVNELNLNIEKFSKTTVLQDQVQHIVQREIQPIVKKIVKPIVQKEIKPILDREVQPFIQE